MGRKTPAPGTLKSNVTLAWPEADLSPSTWHTEYEAEFTSQLGLDSSVHEPLHQASPRWPTSFKKNYVHVEDYRRLECELDNVKAQRDLLAAALAEAEREISNWKNSHRQMEQRVQQKDKAVKDMCKGLRHVQASLDHFRVPSSENEHETSRSPPQTISTVTTLMAHTNKSRQPHPSTSPAALNKKVKTHTKSCYMRAAPKAASDTTLANGEDITIVYGPARPAGSDCSSIGAPIPRQGVLTRYAAPDASLTTSSSAQEILELRNRLAALEKATVSTTSIGSRKPGIPRNGVFEEIESYPAELPAQRYHGHGSWIP